MTLAFSHLVCFYFANFHVQENISALHRGHLSTQTLQGGLKSVRIKGILFTSMYIVHVCTVYTVGYPNSMQKNTAYVMQI